MAISGPPLCLTQGDPSGIGPDLTLSLYAAHAAGQLKVEPFIVLADPALLHRRAALLGLDVKVIEVEPEGATVAFAAGLPVAPLQAAARGEPGCPDRVDAASTIESIRRAVEWVRSGKASAVVTNPIAKSVLYEAGFKHPGHTEFLGKLAQELYGVAEEPVMMLWSRELAVVPTTIHVPLAAVPGLLTRTKLTQTGTIVAKALRELFGVEAPRLFFTGLNPHAGEDGALGREEIDIIAPAIAELIANGIDARGPFAADTMFHAAARARYDVAICMYHDQALIPIKTLAFDRGVNVTLGLPFIRTSPDHGTAFDIAGTGKASTTSLVEAMALAGRLAANLAKTSNRTSQ